MSIIRPSGHVIDTDTLYEFSWFSHGIIIAHSVLKDNPPYPLFFSLGLQIEKIRLGKNSLNRVGINIRMSDAPPEKPVMVLIRGKEIVVIDKWGSEPRIIRPK